MQMNGNELAIFWHGLDFVFSYVILKKLIVTTDIYFESKLLTYFRGSSGTAQRMPDL